MDIIKTKNLILRPIRKEDEGALVKYLNNKTIQKGTRTLPHPFTTAHAKAWIKKNINENKLGNKQSISFAIEFDGELIGSVGSGKIEGHTAKIGYWIAEPFWKKGFATEALVAFSKYAFNEFKFKRLYAHVISFNGGSQRVLEKAGFTLEGRMRKFYKEGEKYYDGFLYAKVK